MIRYAPARLVACLPLALAIGCRGAPAASFGPNKVDLPVLLGARPASASAAPAAAVSAPPSAVTKESPFPAVAHVKLANGMGIDVVTSRALPIVQVRMIVRAGSGYGASPGVATITGDMLKDGGTRAMTSGEVLRRIETLGANLSVATLDQTVWRASEPGTPPPAKRIEAVARLNSAGVPCGVLMGPILPMLSDSDEQIRATVQAAVAAGATNVVGLLLHLRPGVRDHYIEWLAQAFPHLVEPYERRYGARAYLPHAEQKELSTKIARFVEEARVPRRARSGRPGSAPGYVSTTPAAPTNRADRLRGVGMTSGPAEALVARPSETPVALALPLPLAVIA